MECTNMKMPFDLVDRKNDKTREHDQEETKTDGNHHFISNPSKIIVDCYDQQGIHSSKLIRQSPSAQMRNIHTN